MKFPVLFTFIIFLSFASAEAKEVVVKGSAESFAGREIRAYLYKDHITYSNELKATATIDQEEQFALRLDLSRIDYLILKIEDKSTGLLASPGEVYNINLSYSQNLNKDRIYDKKLGLRFSYPRPGELNQLIRKFNAEYERFIADNYKAFARKNTSVIDKFKKKMLGKYSESDNSYFKKYVIYSLAGMEEATRTNKPAFYQKYLSDAPVLFHHIEYMRFFNQFYDKQFKEYAISTDIGLDVMGAVNYYNSYDSLSAILKKKEIMSNDTLRQMVVLKGLKSLYYNKQIQLKQKKVLSMLQWIEKNGICPETQAIAGNIVDELTHFDKGTAAPRFTLTNTGGEKVRLEDFRGQYVYLGFWATWNVPGLKELKLIEKFHEKYGRSIVFISISADDNFSNMKKYLDDKSFGWTFLYAGKHSGVVEDYEARILPRYFLIDPEGNFIQAPAERPTGNIEKALFSIAKGRR